MEDSGARDECQDLLRSRLDDQEAYDGLLQDLGDVGRTACDVLAFQEIQVKALKIMKEEQEKKKQYESIKFGVEKRWEPPKKTAKELEELENPFA